MNIIFLGPPGAGKGTIAKELTHYLHLPHISTGDMFRDNVSQKTELGIKAQEYMDDGKLVPDEIVIAMVKDRLQQEDCSDGFILDGFPRTIEQAQSLSTDVRIDKVINLEVHADEIVRRLENRKKKEGRADDDPDKVRERLKVYKKHTAPLISFYEKAGLLHTVNGVGSIDVVFNRVKTLFA